MGQLRFIALLVMSACFDPRYEPGLACSEGNDCPPDQSCVDVGGIRRCEIGSGGNTTIGCDLISQAGCAADQKCTIDRMSNPQKVCASDGVAGVGEACDGIGSLDMCAKQLVCLYGSCHAFCDITSDQAPCGADTCGAFNGYAACMTACDPLAPACPLSGENCYMDTTGKTQCLPTSGGLVAGSGCSFFNQCEGGAVCHLGICRTYCDYATTPGQQGSCAASLTCQAFFSGVGVCR